MNQTNKAEHHATEPPKKYENQHVPVKVRPLIRAVNCAKK